MAGGSLEFGPDQFVGQVGVGSVRQSRCCTEESPEQWNVRVDGSPVFVYNSECLFGIGAVSSHKGGFLLFYWCISGFVCSTVGLSQSCVGSGRELDSLQLRGGSGFGVASFGQIFLVP